MVCVLDAILEAMLILPFEYLTGIQMFGSFTKTNVV